MLFLSHRGYWRRPAEKNTEAAFARSFELGFGTETDVRDLDGELVISHDPPRRGALPLGRFFELYRGCGRRLPLALNIKSDGVEAMLAEQLAQHQLPDYFAFDMSIPSTLGYLRRGLRFFTRQSEHEREPALYRDAAGVWMDAFEGEWATAADIGRHLTADKRVCLVSPELHRRDPLAHWRQIGGWLGAGAVTNLATEGALMLCTDEPERAQDIVEAARGRASEGGAG